MLRLLCWFREAGDEVQTMKAEVRWKLLIQFVVNKADRPDDMFVKNLAIDAGSPSFGAKKSTHCKTIGATPKKTQLSYGKNWRASQSAR